MDIKKYLGNLGIEYKLYKHPPVYTCEESEKIKVIMKGMHAKSLLVKGKSTGNFYMVIIPCEERIDRKKLKDYVKEDITFASTEDLEKLLNLKPGSVSPFAVINDENNKIIVIFSKKVWESEILNFHPNINTETIEIKNKEFTKYINSLKNKIIIM
ncbi:prolyl-tRNA synthetase associated domain-containing protein [Candidatus Pacearchaeota archaeon]|nr:prolyl-tRNA synthetase associated domain-containing protein [Candidatus Pacearchaeota archaeon]